MCAVDALHVGLTPARAVCTTGGKYTLLKHTPGDGVLQTSDGPGPAASGPVEPENPIEHRMVPRWLYERLLVCSGAVVGATLRFLTLETCLRFSWPAGLLIINAAGSLLIGVAMGIAQAAPDGGQFFRDSLRLFLVIGVLGSMTTFSAFSLDAVNMLRQGQVLSVFTHILAHMVLCIGLCAVGWAATERLLSNP